MATTSSGQEAKFAGAWDEPLDTKLAKNASPSSSGEMKTRQSSSFSSPRRGSLNEDDVKRTPTGRSIEGGTYEEYGEEAGRIRTRNLSAASISSRSSRESKLPLRPGINWKMGARIEAMDFLKKWYPAKIVEVDEDDFTILIHFEGWNQRYDEWVDMTSDRLRPMTRHSDRKEGKPAVKLQHKPSEKVLAKWTDCRMYPAKVLSVNSNGSYDVMFYDGIKKTVQPINLKPMPQHMQDELQPFNTPPAQAKKPGKEEPLARSRSKEKERQRKAALKDSSEERVPVRKRSADQIETTPPSFQNIKRRKLSEGKEKPGKSKPEKPAQKESGSGLRSSNTKPASDASGAEEVIPCSSDSVVRDVAAQDLETVQTGDSYDRRLSTDLNDPFKRRKKLVVGGIFQAKRGKEERTEKEPQDQNHQDKESSAAVTQKSSDAPELPNKSSSSPKSPSRSVAPTQVADGGISPQRPGKLPPSQKSPAGTTQTIPRSPGSVKIEPPRTGITRVASDIKKKLKNKKRAIEAERQAKSEAEIQAKRKLLKNDETKRTNSEGNTISQNLPMVPKKQPVVDSVSPPPPSAAEPETVVSPKGCSPVCDLSSEVPRAQNVLEHLLRGNEKLSSKDKEDVTKKTSSKRKRTMSMPAPALEDSSSQASSDGSLVMKVAPKAFKIEADHNEYKCPFSDCGKGFRKEKLLAYHIKYYHSNNGKPPPPPPPRKRKKTTSTCSTDSEVSITPKQLSSNKPKPAKKIRGHSAPSVIIPESGSLSPETPNLHEVKRDTTKEKEKTPERLKELVAAERERQDSIGNESVDIVTEDERPQSTSRDEIVNCICRCDEENGLMIQCEECLTWQHVVCINISEESLPQKYVCWICLNPPGMRESARYKFDQDWLNEGTLPRFNFLSTKDKGRRSPLMKATHSLAGDMHHINQLINGNKRKLFILNSDDHEDQKIWTRNWEKEADIARDRDSMILTDNVAEVELSAGAIDMETDQTSIGHLGMEPMDTNAVNNLLSSGHRGLEIRDYDDKSFFQYSDLENQEIVLGELENESEDATDGDAPKTVADDVTTDQDSKPPWLSCDVGGAGDAESMAAKGDERSDDCSAASKTVLSELKPDNEASSMAEACQMSVDKNSNENSDERSGKSDKTPIGDVDEPDEPDSVALEQAAPENSDKNTVQCTVDAGGGECVDGTADTVDDEDNTSQSKLSADLPEVKGDSKPELKFSFVKSDDLKSSDTPEPDQKEMKLTSNEDPTAPASTSATSNGDDVDTAVNDGDNLLQVEGCHNSGRSSAALSDHSYVPLSSQDYKLSPVPSRVRLTGSSVWTPVSKNLSSMDGPSCSQGVATIVTDPCDHCRQNLLDHISCVQDEIDERLDFLEDQVAALEAMEENKTPHQDPLADLPQVKKSLRTLLCDLAKVQRLSTFH